MVYRIALLFSIVLASVSINAHAEQAPEAASSDARVHQLRLHPKFVRYTGEPVRNNRTQRQWQYEFVLKGGSVHPRSPMNDLVLDFVRTGESFSVDLDRWTDRAAGLALPLAKYFTKRGYKVTPSDARIAVIYPTTYYPGSGMRLGDYAHFQAQSDRELYLLYADRPCHIQGGTPASPESGALTYDVRIDAPGFHLISRSRDLQGNETFAASAREMDIGLVTVFLR